MVKKIIVLVLLLFGFVLFLLIKYLILDTKNSYGRLKIDSTPVSSVFINNVAIGRVPFEDKYKTGEYILKLIPEDIATSTASWQHKIKINRNSLTFVHAELGDSVISTSAKVLSISASESKQKNNKMGEVYIETDPSGAIVYFDNDEKGVSPLLISDIIEGNHEISVFMPGFFRNTESLKITGMYKVNAFMKLAIDEKQQNILNKREEKTASPEASISQNKTMIIVKETPTGWLRVRYEPNLNASESGRAQTGHKFELLEERDEWQKIKYDSSNEGWISSIYTDKLKE